MARRLDELYRKAVPILKSIPEGRVASYAWLAKRLGVHPRIAGMVVAMNRRKDVPCHRVVRSDGSPGGYSLGSIDDKVEKLRKEGVEIRNGKISREFFI